MVDHKPMASEPPPIQGVLALLNPLLCRATFILEVHYPFRSYQQVGQAKAHSGKRFALMPFSLGHHPPGAIAASRLLKEVVVSDDRLLKHFLGRRL